MSAIEVRDLFKVAEYNVGVPGNEYDDGAAALGAAIDTKFCAGVHLAVEASAFAAGATLLVELYDCDTVGGSYALVTGGAMDSMTAAGVATRSFWQKTRQFVKVRYTVGVDAVTFSAQVLLTGLKTTS